MSEKKVVTYRSSSTGKKIDICSPCEMRLQAAHAWPKDARGVEMVDVHMGLHRGECQAPGHGKEGP